MIHTSRISARTAAIARLLTLGATVVIASATSPISAADGPFDGAKMLADVQTYVDFGVHRTGTPGDIATRDWLVARFKSLGFDVGLEPFTVNQFLLDGASVVIDGRRYEAMPFWHPHQIGSKPIEGSIVFIQGNSVTAAVKGKIAVLGVDAAAAPAMFGRLAGQGAIGVIVTSRVDVGVPVMENVQPPFVDRPTPLPAVIVASNAGEPLKAAASEGKAVSISVTGTEGAKCVRRKCDCDGHARRPRRGSSCRRHTAGGMRMPANVDQESRSCSRWRNAPPVRRLASTTRSS